MRTFDFPAPTAIAGKPLLAEMLQFTIRVWEMSTPPEVLIVAHSFLAPPRSPPRNLMLLASTFTTRSWAQVQKFAHPAFTSLNSTSAAASITMLLPVPQAYITPPGTPNGSVKSWHSRLVKNPPPLVELIQKPL